MYDYVEARLVPCGDGLPAGKMSQKNHPLYDFRVLLLLHLNTDSDRSFDAQIFPIPEYEILLCPINTSLGDGGDFDSTGGF